MKFDDFKTFPHCSYRIDVAWTYLEKQIQSDNEIGLDLNPDFQRAHVWSRQQQESYVEYILKGGTSGKELYFNCAGWGSDFHGPYVIVDGKQRLEAVRLFMQGKIKAFGYHLNEYNSQPHMLVARFSWNIAALKTKNDVLKWYLDFNSGGVVHTRLELDKVRNMIK